MELIFIVMASGGSFPLSQGIFPLVGIVLGPIAGAIANGIGTLIGIFIAPHTAGVPYISVMGALATGFAAGAMTIGLKRKSWAYIVGAVAIASILYVCYRAIFVNGVQSTTMLIYCLQYIICILLYILPTRTLFIKWIQTKNVAKMAVGLFFTTWITSVMINMFSTVFTYTMFNWPEEVFYVLVPTIPFEMLMRSVVGVVIGLGVIAGLRSIGLVKPVNSLY